MRLLYLAAAAAGLWYLSRRTPETRCDTESWEYKMIDGRCYWCGYCKNGDVEILEADMAWCAAAAPL